MAASDHHSRRGSLHRPRSKFDDLPLVADLGPAQGLMPKVGSAASSDGERGPFATRLLGHLPRRSSGDSELVTRLWSSPLDRAGISVILTSVGAGKVSGP